jgi:hypothetical protein
LVIPADDLSSMRRKTDIKQQPSTQAPQPPVVQLSDQLPRSGWHTSLIGANQPFTIRPCDPASAGIVNALVGLGHGLELTIAADGVEGADQEASLVRSGCEQGQGQFFSAPIRATEIADLFGSEATASLRRLARN